MRTSPLHLIAAIPVALGVAVGPAVQPTAVDTPAPVEMVLVAQDHRGMLSYSDSGSPKAYIVLGEQRVLLSSEFTGTFPTSEDTATIRVYYEDYLGLKAGTSIICVHGILRHIGPLALIEIEDLCT